MPLDVAAFLAEPGRMAQVAAVSPSGVPLLGSLWFLWADDRFWLHSHPSTPLPQAAARGEQVALIVDDFDPPTAIRQVRVRGRAQVEPSDPARVRALYARYLGADEGSWAEQWRRRVEDPGWTLWSVGADSGVAATNPGFRNDEVRWTSAEPRPWS